MIMIMARINHDQVSFPLVGAFSLAGCSHMKLFPLEKMLLTGELNGFLLAFHPVFPVACIY